MTTTSRTAAAVRAPRCMRKTLVFDCRIFFVGSMNLDPRSALTNTEIGIVVDAPERSGAPVQRARRRACQGCVPRRAAELCDRRNARRVGGTRGGPGSPLLGRTEKHRVAALDVRILFVASDRAAALIRGHGSLTRAIIRAARRLRADVLGRSTMKRCMSRALAAALLVIIAAGTGAQAAPPAATDSAKAPSATRQLALNNKPWTGDFDAMLERRLIRVYVPYSRSLYFIDKGRERGLGAELVARLRALGQPEIREAARQAAADRHYRRRDARQAAGRSQRRARPTSRSAT